MSTICGSDLHTTLGARPAPVPIILGHEITGRVAALGKGVTTDTMGRPLKEGDRITWTIFANCGNCYFCKIKALPMKCVKLFKYGHETCSGCPAPERRIRGILLHHSGHLRLQSSGHRDRRRSTPANCGLATIMQAYDGAEFSLKITS